MYRSYVRKKKIIILQRKGISETLSISSNNDSVSSFVLLRTLLLLKKITVWFESLNRSVPVLSVQCGSSNYVRTNTFQVLLKKEIKSYCYDFFFGLPWAVRRSDIVKCKKKGNVRVRVYFLSPLLFFWNEKKKKVEPSLPNSSSLPPPTFFPPVVSFEIFILIFFFRFVLFCVCVCLLLVVKYLTSPSSSFLYTYYVRSFH